MIWVVCYCLAMKNTLAIDIGGTNFSIAIFEGASLFGKLTHSTDRKAGPTGILNQIEKMLRVLWRDGAIHGCGIGFGGPVDFAAQKVVASTHVDGWEGFDLVREVETRFCTPVVIDRDSMVGVLGEGYFGAGRGIRPLFYITLSTGIGGGLLTASGLYRGADSFACELGHHTVVPDGPACLCGSNGCLERMCSGLWLERDYGRPAQELFMEPEFVSRYVIHLAQGIKSCLMFLNPARIVIGGGISQAADLLFIPLRKELDRQMTSWWRASVEVVPAALVGESVLWGALALATEHIYHQNPASLDCVSDAVAPPLLQG
jgi:glucokinase